MPSNVFRPSGEPLPEPDRVQLNLAVRCGWMAQAAVWQLDGEPRHRTLAGLAWTYQLTSVTAFKLGDPGLGWVATDRGIQGDRTHRGPDADRLGGPPRLPTRCAPPEPGCRHPRPLSSGAALPHRAAGQPAYGMLPLKGCIVAARLGQAVDVVELQAEALDVPGNLGADLGHMVTEEVLRRLTKEIMTELVCSFIDQPALGLQGAGRRARCHRQTPSSSAVPAVRSLGWVVPRPLDNARRRVSIWELRRC